jgi:hypothetical protein
VSTPGPGGQPPPYDPSASGQAGWGQQPPAGQPGPAQPWSAPQGAPGAQPWSAPQGAPGGAPAFGAPVQPKKRNKWLPIVGGIVAVLVVLGVLSTVLGAGDPKVGDCINAADSTSYETVDCNSADAQYRVVGTDADMTGAEFDATPPEEMCTDVPSATVVLWSGTNQDEDGHVFCAADN